MSDEDWHADATLEPTGDLENAYNLAFTAALPPAKRAAALAYDEARLHDFELEAIDHTAAVEACRETARCAYRAVAAAGFDTSDPQIKATVRAARDAADEAAAN